MRRHSCQSAVLALAFGAAILASSCVSEETPEPKISGYQPTWESLTRHPLPEWFRDAKFGIFTHWGPYSVPGFGNEWYARWMYVDQEVPRRGNFFQFHKENFGDPSEFGYKDFIPMFTAEKFDPESWAILFRKAGARFAGPVAQHHDGFAMWNSQYTDWDAFEMGPKRDVVGELSEAIRRQGLKVVTSFHHTRSWWYYEPSYTEDQRYDTQDSEYSGLYPEPHSPGAPPNQAYMQNWESRVVEVIDNYRPDLIWFDGGLNREMFLRSALPAFMAYKQRVLAHYYNQATRWGCEVGVTYKDDDLPKGVGILDVERGRVENRTDYVWLTDTSIDRLSWGYVRDSDYKPVNEIVDVLVDVVSKNGCLLLNIGPMADGTIPEAVEERLLELGDWLRINGKAIFGTRPWVRFGEGPTVQPQGEFGDEEVVYTAENIRFTTKGSNLFAILLDWPRKEIVISSLGFESELADTTIDSVRLVGSEEELEWRRGSRALVIQVPKQKPCEHAFVFEIALKRGG